MIFAAIADWAESKQYPVEFMCAELGVSTSGYYAWRQRPVSEHARADEALLRLIGVLFDRLQGNPGVRRIHAELVSQGHRVARKRVWRLMKAAGLQGRHPGPREARRGRGVAHRVRHHDVERRHRGDDRGTAPAGGRRDSRRLAADGLGRGSNGAHAQPVPGGAHQH